MKTTISPELLRMMAARGTTPWRVMEQLGINRIHGAQVFAGRKSGKPTRRKLARLLTPKELAVLGWELNGTLRTDLQVVREEESIRQVVQLLGAYQASRAALQRVVAVVEAHPEVFGSVAAGESYLDLAARKLEALAQKEPRTPVAAANGGYADWIGTKPEGRWGGW